MSRRHSPLPLAAIAIIAICVLAQRPITSKNSAERPDHPAVPPAEPWPPPPYVGDDIITKAVAISEQDVSPSALREIGLSAAEVAAVVDAVTSGPAPENRAVITYVVVTLNAARMAAIMGHCETKTEEYYCLFGGKRGAEIVFSDAQGSPIRNPVPHHISYAPAGGVMRAIYTVIDDVPAEVSVSHYKLKVGSALTKMRPAVAPQKPTRRLKHSDRK